MTFDFDKALNQAGAIIVALAPPAEQALTGAGAPEYAAGLSIAEKVIQGLMRGEPAAKVLVSQIKGGTPLTAAQAKDFEAITQGDYERSKVDLAAAITAAPA